ncbi:MAG: DMT family transporter [Treponema sp.]|nr:DMT family transporter [Treponema sp.]
MERIGELAAFSAAAAMSTGALFFERGIKHIGVLSVNFIKVVVAFILLTITATITRGMPLPIDASNHALLLLSISGIIGFLITDMFLFSVYATVGPRIAMLFMALSPPVTAGIAYIFLGETIGPRGGIGMALVITGIFIVVFARQGSMSFLKINSKDRLGYIFGVIACIGQSVGMVLTKAGIGDYDPISGTQIRIFAAVIGYAIVSFIYKRGEGIKKAIRSKEGLKFTLAGSVFGPFLGVFLSLYALQRISTGIVSTLMGLAPIVIIVPEILIFKKKIKPLEIFGALVAVAGTTIFFT